MKKIYNNSKTGEFMKNQEFNLLENPKNLYMVSPEISTLIY